MPKIPTALILSPQGSFSPEAATKYLDSLQNLGYLRNELKSSDVLDVPPELKLQLSQLDGHARRQDFRAWRVVAKVALEMHPVNLNLLYAISRTTNNAKIGVAATLADRDILRSYHQQRAIVDVDRMMKDDVVHLVTQWTDLRDVPALQRWIVAEAHAYGESPLQLLTIAYLTTSLIKGQRGQHAYESLHEVMSATESFEHKEMIIYAGQVFRKLTDGVELSGAVMLLSMLQERYDDLSPVRDVVGRFRPTWDVALGQRNLSEILLHLLLYDLSMFTVTANWYVSFLEEKRYDIATISVNNEVPPLSEELQKKLEQVSGTDAWAKYCDELLRADPIDFSTLYLIGATAPYVQITLATGYVCLQLLNAAPAAVTREERLNRMQRFITCVAEPIAMSDMYLGQDISLSLTLRRLAEAGESDELTAFFIASCVAYGTNGRHEYTLLLNQLREIHAASIGEIRDCLGLLELSHAVFLMRIAPGSPEFFHQREVFWKVTQSEEDDLNYFRGYIPAVDQFIWSKAADRHTASDKKKVQKAASSTFDVQNRVNIDAGSDPVQDLHRLLARQNFADADEANAFMQNLVGKPIPEIPLSELTESEIVEDLVRQSERYSAPERRKVLLRLSRDYPKSPAPWLGLCDVPENHQQHLQYAEEGIVRSVPYNETEYKLEHAGHYWLLSETRPYIRLLSHKALALHSLRRTEESMNVLELILHLNPMDNIGVRQHLLTMLFERGQRQHLVRIEQLLEMFNDDESVEVVWSRLWYLIITKSPWTEISAAYEKAKACNAYVAKLINGERLEELDRRRTSSTSDSVLVGGVDEALYYVNSLSGFWKSWPQLADAMRKIKRERG